MLFSLSKIEIPTSISVLNANHSFHKAIRDFIRDHGHQGAPSPLFEQYVSKRKETDTAVIIFLNESRQPHCPFQFSMDGAIESQDCLDLVVEEIAKTK